MAVISFGVRAASVAAAVGFLVIAAFQVALAAGAPLGRAAWGGRSARLPTRLRVASGIAVAVWVFAALIVLGRAGFEISPLPAGFVTPAIWVLFGVMVLGALMNFASPSRWAPFPSGNRLQCPSCGAEMDLADARRQLEAQARRPIVIEGES